MTVTECIISYGTEILNVEVVCVQIFASYECTVAYCGSVLQGNGPQLLTIVETSRSKVFYP